MNSTLPQAVSASEAVDLLTGLAWPVLVGLVVWKLLPSIRRVIDSRGFTIHAGGMEISVQEASQALGERLEDLREQLSALRAEVEHGASGAALESAPVTAAASPIATGLAGLAAVLWVDDYPENNAFEVETLRRKDVRVLQAGSTDEGVRMLDDHPEIAALITDMGRKENGRVHDEAGVDLIELALARRPELPVLVYASAPAIARSGEKARAAGARIATASATELLDALGRIGRG
jgi:CheY-like chemotaxis protein